MKRILSVLCVLALILSFAAVSASAVESAQTVVEVVPGDKVSYQLYLSDVDEKVVGCDFSVYYDSSVFEVESVADFTNSTNEDDWRAVINYDLDGEVIGNWSILRGVDFSSGGNVVTVNFKAKSSASTHLSYYVRYMYPESMVEFTKYKFTCNVTKNGSNVLVNAKPELNPEKTRDPGEFENSVDGDSKNAGQGVTKPSGSTSSNSGEPNENTASSASGTTSSGSSTGTSSSGGSSSAADTDSSDSSSALNTPSSKASVETIISTDAEGNEVITVLPASPSQAQGGGTSPALWIILGVIVVAGGCVAAYFLLKKKKA